MKQFAIFVVAAALFLSNSCAPGKLESRAAVYFWKTVMDWNEADDRNLSASSVGEIDVRIFDWDVPGNKERTAIERIGTLLVKKSPGPQYRLVPVVYVTQAALTAWAQSSSNAEQRAQILWNNVQDFIRAQRWEKIEEVQIDADWNKSTRDAYFETLRSLKKMAQADSMRLSVTVRLHQFRDRVEQGIPPVDSAVLMLYGMENPTNFDSPYNTVLDSTLAKAYLEGQSAYPVALSYALPVYSVARQFNAYGRFVALVSNVDPSQLSLPEFAPKGSWYQAQTSTTLAGRPVMANDVVKLERAEAKQVEETWNILKKASSFSFGSPEKILFFDYDKNEWSSDENQKIRALIFR